MADFGRNDVNEYKYQKAGGLRAWIFSLPPLKTL